MSDTLHDDSLWNRRKEPDPQLAAIERELSTLAWRPRPLSLPPAIAAHVSVPIASLRPTLDRSRSRDSSRWRRRPALLAGLAMAATVLGAIWLSQESQEGSMKSGQPDHEFHDSIEPAGQPQRSPDLRDPFSSPSNPDASSSGDLVDPFDAPREQTPTAPPQSDLKDPFSRNPHRGPNRPAERPDPRSSDLKDPFAGDPSPQSTPGSIVDPFRDQSSVPSKQSGPDLKDPFGKHD